jgi:hypothetical protein
MLKPWIYNGSEKLWFQQEVSKSRTMDPNVAPAQQKKIQSEEEKLKKWLESVIKSIVW